MSKIKSKIGKCYMNILWCLNKFLPVDKNKVLVTCFLGKGYFDNPKYIADQLHEMNPDLKIVCLVQNVGSDLNIPEYVIQKKYNEFNIVYEMSTSKIWIDNCRKSFRYKKKANQFYVQTWHGGIAIKAIEKDIEETLSQEYMYYSKIDSKKTDVILSNSKFLTDTYKRAFWYDGEILELGLPRYDIFFEKDKTTYYNEKVKESFQVSKDTKIILYAPTFRDDYSMDAYDLDYEKLVETMEQKWKKSVCLLVRLHPNVAHLSKKIQYSEKVLDATGYPDGQELLIASDLFITDYSAMIFDFAMLRKPAIIYANDFKEYTKMRKLCFELDKLPFPLAMSKDEMENTLETFDEEKYRSELDEFFQENTICEKGSSSKDVAAWILNKIVTI